MSKHTHAVRIIERTGTEWTIYSGNQLECETMLKELISGGNIYESEVALCVEVNHDAKLVTKRSRRTNTLPRQVVALSDKE
jgi:hypothetical protein